MRHLSRETVCGIIAKAREFQAKVAIVDPDSGSNAADDAGRDVLQDDPDDATLEELRHLIDDLNQDEAVELVSLFWIGRGEFTAGALDAAMIEARRHAAESPSRYLIAQPLLAEFLLDGLQAFGQSCEEFET